MIDDIQYAKGLAEKGFSWISDYADVDIMEIAEQIQNNSFSFSGTLARYEFNKRVREAITYYLSGDFNSAIEEIYWFMIFCFNNIAEIKNSEKLKGLIKTFSESVPFLEETEKLKELWKQEWEQELTHAGFKPTIEFDNRTIYKIKNSIDNRYLHLYCYRKGGNVTQTSKFKIYDVIVASDNINDFISLNNEDGYWTVRTGMFIEKFINLSYFVITISQGNTVYILTDKPEYTYLDQISSVASRNGGRRFSESREESLDFMPYILIDKIIEKRNENETITKQAGQEIYTFEFGRYFGWNLYFLIKFIIEKISSENVIKPLMTVNQLAIGCGETIDLEDKNSFCKIGTEEMDEIFNELYNNEETTSTALAIPAKTIIEELQLVYKNTSLVTPEQFDKNCKYLAHKKIAKDWKLQKLNSVGLSNNPDSLELTYSSSDIYKAIRTQRKQLISLIKSKLNDLLPIIFSGDRVTLYDIDHPYMTSGFGNEKKERTINEYYDLVTEAKEKKWSDETIGALDDYEGFLCNGGDRYAKNVNFYRNINFYRYTEIYTLLGITRSQLPSLFQYYLSHMYMPYIGNSILDNVLPEYQEIANDFVSRYYPNGISLSIPFCGFCSKKYFKQYKIAEKTVVVISSKQNKIIEIKNINDFKKEDYETKN